VKTKRPKDPHQALSTPAKITIVACLLLIILTGILLILGAFVFGFVGLFKITGTQYDSLSTLLLFLIMFFIIAFIVDFISIFLIKLFSEQIRSSKKRFIVRLIIDCTFSWFAIHTADELMGSVSIPLVTELIAVVLLFLLEVYLDMAPKKKVNKKKQLNA
jgi:ABC-type bacteriocin/lantibiotic exporter with double-glycine peptidase domain